MGQLYNQLSSDERNFIHSSLNEGRSHRWISSELKRNCATISREIQRNKSKTGQYDAHTAINSCLQRRRRGLVKLRGGTVLRHYVMAKIRLGWSPEQISGKLKIMPQPALPSVSHETIYQAIYLIPRGELRKEIIEFLRHAHKKRGKRARGENRQGKIIDMVSIHERPENVKQRLVAGDWEADFVKGAGNRSAIGTVVERKSRYTMIIAMKNCSAEAALEGFTEAFNKVPQALRTSFTYDQGKEMARHKELSKALNINVYFCDPHSPWQRPTNENLNGLVRQYLPKGTDMTLYDQDDLDEIAKSLNQRPRKILGFLTPEQVYMQEIEKLGVALQS
jgi:transposase, IS30 family